MGRGMDSMPSSSSSSSSARAGERENTDRKAVARRATDKRRASLRVNNDFIRIRTPSCSDEAWIIPL
jgi:hypothetical protein